MPAGYTQTPAGISDYKQTPVSISYYRQTPASIFDYNQTLAVGSGQWAEFLFCTGTGQPRPPQSPAALQAGSGEPKARVLTWHLSMGV